MPRKLKCKNCGYAPEDEEDDIYYGWNDEPLCYDCYCEKRFICCLCEEYGNIKDQHNMVVVFDPEDAGVGEMKPGIYRVTDEPYFTHAVIGSGWLHEWAIEWIVEIPKDADADGYPCDHLCLKCQKKITAPILTRELSGDYEFIV